MQHKQILTYNNLHSFGIMCLKAEVMPRILRQFFRNFRKQKPVTGSLYNDGPGIGGIR